MKQRSALLSAISFTFVLLALLGISLTAQAAPDENISARPQALLLNDNFDYGATAMSLTVASGGNWVNHSGSSPYVGYTTTSLSMAGYGSSGMGGAATILTTGSEDVNRSFTIQTSGTIYFAALVNVASAGSGTYFMHLKDATISGFRARVFARNDAGVLRFGLDTSGNTGTYATGAYSYTTTYLLVTKYDVITGATALYVLDAASASEPAIPDVSFTTGTTLTIQAVGIRQGTNGPSAIIDGVRVADTWEDVVGYVPPPPEANLNVAKFGPATATAGDPITYIINLSNTGNTTATLSVLTDTLPAEVTFVTYTTALPVTFTQLSAQTLVWELGDVASGASGTITLQGTISAGANGGTVFTNTVTASTATTETQLANNTDSAPTLIPVADLAVLKTGPATASAGETITYTLSLSNTGTATAPQTVVTDTLPAEVIFVSTTTTLPVTFTWPALDTLVWELGDVAAGAGGTILVQVSISPTLSAGTLFTNTVTASTTAVENNTANNTAPASTLIGAPDLTVVKTGPTSVNVGDPIAFTLTYRNAGNLDATGVVLVDQLPTAMTYVTDSLGTGVQNGGTITWTIGNLASGASGSVVLTASTSAIGDWPNVAVISGGPVDSNLLNNTSSFTATVLGVDPFVLKSGPAQVFGGDVVSYTITYGNHGNLPAAVTITDTLPISITTSDIAFDDGPPNPIDNTNTRSWTATLQAGDRFTFTLALTVPASIANNTRITNTLEITSTGLGNNPSNDLSSASSAVYQIVPISVARAGTIGQIFGVEGQVIYVPSTFGTNEWGLQDASGGISAFFSSPPSMTLGDRVRLVATRGAFSNQEQLAAPVYYSATLGSGPLVQPIPYTTGQIASGSTEGWLSVITGTVSGLTACTGNYQFNLDDGSGSTVVFVDADTGVNVCALGVVNGDRLVVTGFSTQFSATFEVKPRFPADVKQLFDVTFIYNDLEDAVLVGEDVQLRGDFTSWGTNPITMTHDANYTVFSATVTLPTTATQGYKYYAASLSDPLAWDLLNTNNRSITPTQGVTVKNDYRNVVVGWGNLNGPATQTINLGSATAFINGQVYVQSVTNPGGPGRGLRAEVGYGNSVDPSSWSWFATLYITNTGDNDVYAGTFTPTASGVYSYAMRYNGNWGVGNPNAGWTYGDLNGIPFSPDQAGVLTVTAPQLSLSKAVATTHDPVELGEIVTYTLTLVNTGDGTANGILISDVLPIEVTFGGFVQQNGATFGSGTVAWSGSLNASAQVQVVFTATVETSVSYLGHTVTNTVSMTADNATGQAASATFNIIGAPQLALTKAVATTHDPVELGEIVTYTLTLSNSGSGPATGVLITDGLPAEVTFGGFVQQNGATFGSGTVSWSGSLNASAQVQVVFTATVETSVSYLGHTVTNTVSMTADNATGQAASATFNIVGLPQLALNKAVVTTHNPAELGEVVTYTLTLSNSGSGPATGVMITDVLPTAVTFGGFVQQNGATFSGGTVAWSGSLNVGAQVQIVFTATVKVNLSYLGQVVTNTVSMTADNATGQAASATFNIVNPPQLAINKTVVTTHSLAELGEVVTYTLTLSNSGSGPATGVVISDVLPTAVTFGGFVQQNGATFSGGTVSWSGSLNAGAQVQVVFTATVANNPALYGTDVTNEVQFTSGNGGSGNASIAFAIVKRYFIYTPLIQR